MYTLHTGEETTYEAIIEAHKAGKTVIITQEVPFGTIKRLALDGQHFDTQYQTGITHCRYYTSTPESAEYALLIARHGKINA